MRLLFDAIFSIREFLKNEIEYLWKPNFMFVSIILTNVRKNNIFTSGR